MTPANPIDRLRRSTPAGVTRELRRSLPLFVLPFMMELLTILRSQPWWPHLVQLP